MYGFVSVDGVVGQLFDSMPGEDRYHESFRAQIVALPEGVASGWRYINGEFSPPAPAEETEPLGYDERLNQIEEILDGMTGGALFAARTFSGDLKGITEEADNGKSV